MSVTCPIFNAVSTTLAEKVILTSEDNATYLFNVASTSSHLYLPGRCSVAFFPTPSILKMILIPLIFFQHANTLSLGNILQLV